MRREGRRRENRRGWRREDRSVRDMKGKDMKKEGHTIKEMPIHYPESGTDT